MVFVRLPVQEVQVPFAPLLGGLGTHTRCSSCPPAGQSDPGLVRASPSRGFGVKEVSTPPWGLGFAPQVSK